MTDKKKVLIINEGGSTLGNSIKQYIQLFGLGLFEVNVLTPAPTDPEKENLFSESNSFDYVITSNSPTDLSVFGNTPVIFKMPVLDNMGSDSASESSLLDDVIEFILYELKLSSRHKLSSAFE